MEKKKENNIDNQEDIEKQKKNKTLRKRIDDIRK